MIKVTKKLGDYVLIIETDAELTDENLNTISNFTKGDIQ